MSAPGSGVRTFHKSDLCVIVTENPYASSTCSTLATRSVGFPFSSSDMKRIQTSGLRLCETVFLALLPDDMSDFSYVIHNGNALCVFSRTPSSSFFTERERRGDKFVISIHYPIWHGAQMTGMSLAEHGICTHRHDVIQEAETCLKSSSYPQRKGFSPLKNKGACHVR